MSIVILLLIGSIQLIKADIYIDFGYGLSRTFSNNYGKSFFGGLVTGLRYDYAFRDSMLWDFGISYVQRGGRDEIINHPSSGVAVHNGWSTFQYDYLSIPVLFKYRDPHSTIMRTSFFIGPRFDFRINFKEKLELKNYDAYGYCVPSESGLNFFIVGAKAGLEFNPFFRSTIGPSMRAGIDIDISPLTRSSENYTIKMAIDFTGSIAIRPKKKE
jgi:hypothetical protein